MVGDKTLKLADAAYRSYHTYVWWKAGPDWELSNNGDKVTVGLKPTAATDIAPPRLVGARVNGATLVLTFDEEPKTSSVPAASAFDVEVAGSDRTLASASPVAVSGYTVTLTLSSAAGYREVVEVSYDKPGSNPLEDSAGNDVADFDWKVANDTPNPALRNVVFDVASVTVDEAGTATYRVKLAAAPEAGNPVAVRIGPHSLIEASPEQVTLDTGNWSTGVEVTLTAVRDGDGVDNETRLRHRGHLVGNGAGKDGDGEVFLPVTMRDTNAAPRVASGIPSQSLIAGQSFSYTFPAGAFHDPDGDTLSYTSWRFPNHIVGQVWPSWLEFDAATRTFSGTPQQSDVGVYRMYVQARDGYSHLQAYTAVSFHFRVYESLQAQLSGRPLSSGPVRSRSFARWIPRAGSEGCRVNVDVRFLDHAGEAVAVDTLSASDFTVENGRLGTPVRHGDGWRVPAWSDRGFTGLMRVKLLAKEPAPIPEVDPDDAEEGEEGEVDLPPEDLRSWGAAEQVFRVSGGADCAPVARNELASLALGGLALDPAFDVGTTAYTAQAAADKARTTVSAAAVYGTASVSIAPADADAETEGHQVALAEGENAVTVTVTPSDGDVAARTWTVTVTRAAADPDGTRAGAVSLGAQSPAEGRQYFRGKSLDRANGDRVDYYTFTTDGRYQLGLGVRDQSVELAVTLENADGETVGTAGPPKDPAKDQLHIEWLAQTIEPGTYYVRVEALADGATDYYIRFGLEDAPAPVVADPDGTRAGAVSLGAQSPAKGLQYFRDKSLGRANGDAVDYYRFTTDGRYALGLGVRGQSVSSPSRWRTRTARRWGRPARRRTRARTRSTSSGWRRRSSPGRTTCGWRRWRTGRRTTTSASASGTRRRLPR